MPHSNKNDADRLIDTADGPVRQCAATRERLAQTGMVRFVLSPDGAVTPDVRSRLPGRGVWVKAERAALDAAVKRGGFARGFKRAVEIPSDLSDMVEAQLLHLCQGALGMAKKAGAIVLGFDQVKAALRKSKPGWLLEASDGAQDGRNKIRALCRALYDEAPVSGALSSEELGMAFGRDRVIHGLIVVGPFSERWREEYARLTGFRTRPEDIWFSGKDGNEAARG